MLLPTQAAILPIGPGSIMTQEIKSGRSDAFPAVTGSNLEGKLFQIPTDLESDLNVLIVAFKRKQQEDINPWIDELKKIKNNKFSIYEVPTLKQMNNFVRFNINNGMRYGIPSKEQREKTITLYLDKESFKKRLAIKTEDEIIVFVVNKSGKILHREQGLFTKAKLNKLKKFL